MPATTIVTLTALVTVAALCSAATLPTGRTWQPPLVLGQEGDRIMALAQTLLDTAHPAETLSVTAAGQDQADHQWYVVQGQGGQTNVLCAIGYTIGYTAVTDSVCGDFEPSRAEEIWTGEYNRAEYVARAKGILEADATA